MKVTHKKIVFVSGLHATICRLDWPRFDKNLSVHLKIGPISSKSAAVSQILEIGQIFILSIQIGKERPTDESQSVNLLDSNRAENTCRVNRP